MHRNPQLQSPFAFHQSPDRTKTGFSALDGKGFVKNKMGSHLEPALKTYRRLDQHNRERSVIHRSRFGRPQDIARFLWIRPIDNDGLIALTRYSTERIVGNLHRAYAELAGTPRGGQVDVMGALADMVTYNGGKPLTCLA